MPPLLLATSESLVQRDVPWWLRLGLVVAGLAVWLWTQRLLGRRPPLPPEEEAAAGALLVTGDAVLHWTAPAHAWLQARPRAANALLIVSSLVIDLMTLWLLVESVIGASLRPYFGLMFLFSLRQVFQALSRLPVPPGVIWRYPGWPSLVVTYGVGNDLFFSGHTALAVFGALELARTGHPVLIALSVAVIVFEVVVVLLLRAHYTFDVYAGAVTAGLISLLMDRVIPTIDARVAAACRWLL